VHELWIILSKVPPRVCNVFTTLTPFFLSRPFVSPSAAGQAITSFIRNHMQRCDLEQDQPLLLKHTLSGTPSDDDLVPALHSRSGGAHCALNDTEQRVTNFRRGTVIWYLSRAAGAPAPLLVLASVSVTISTLAMQSLRSNNVVTSGSGFCAPGPVTRMVLIRTVFRAILRDGPQGQIIASIETPGVSTVDGRHPDPSPHSALSKGVNDGPMSHASSEG
jgi:hypothetical protein